MNYLKILILSLLLIIKKISKMNVKLSKPMKNCLKIILLLLFLSLQGKLKIKRFKAKKMKFKLKIIVAKF